MTTKTNGKLNSIKTSASTLSLNVTSEAEFKVLYKGYRDAVASTKAAHQSSVKKLGQAKRENLWNDLGAALAVAEVLMAPERAEWLFEALDYHNIPVVEDPSKANEFLLIVRLIMGYYPPKLKSWKEGNPEPSFTWDRSIEVYAKVLRAAKEAELSPAKLVERLKTDKGYNKLKQADDRRNLANDSDEKDRSERAKAVRNDTPKALIDAAPFKLPKKDCPTLVALWAVVVSDGKQLSIQGMLNTSVSAIEAHIDKVSPTLYSDILLRREKEKNAELQRRYDDEVAAGRAKVYRGEVADIGAEAGL